MSKRTVTNNLNSKLMQNDSKNWSKLEPRIPELETLYQD